CVNFIPPAKDDFMSLAVAEEYPPGKYQSVPRWNMLIFALFLAYALCDLDKVNLSVAILPISKLFGLTEADVGIASSYMLTQLPAATLMQKLPGGPVTALSIGVLVQSLGTIGTAFLQYVPDGDRETALTVLCVSRCFVGLGEGIGLPTFGALLARLPAERLSSGTSCVMAGSTTGVAVGLLICPFLITLFDWPFVFWAFAFLGLFWTAWWHMTSAKLLPSRAGSSKTESSKTAPSETVPSAGSSDMQSGCDPDSWSGAVPWAAIIRNRAVWALVATHAMSNIGFYSLLAWVPSWYSKGCLAFLPYIFGAIASPIVGTNADRLFKENWEFRSNSTALPGLGLLWPCSLQLAQRLVRPHRMLVHHLADRPFRHNVVPRDVISPPI
ncbi:unnamed protein product, partial [Polarella glacialis]